MKIKVIISSCFITMCLVFFSCSQDDAVYYSCNSDVNAWVNENLPDIRKMSRSEWCSLDESLKRGTYVAFEPKQKQTFWAEKIQEVLSLDWNDAEKEHIQILYQAVLDNPNWFSENRTEEEYELFQYKWIDYAKEQLGWSMEQMGAIVASGNKVVNTNGDIQKNTSSTIRLKNGSEFYDLKTCDCNTTSMYICVSSIEYCKSDCDKTFAGCGFLFLHECNGICSLIGT